MLDAHKMQCLTTAQRLRGYMASITDDYEHELLFYMLAKAADLLTTEWNTYASEHGYEQYDLSMPRAKA